MSRVVHRGGVTQRGAVTLIAVILLITVVTFSALVAALYTNTGVTDTLSQDNSIAALFLATTGLENANYNLSVSSTCSNAGVGTGTTVYGRGSFEIVSGTPSGSLCQITTRGTIGSVMRTIQADVRAGSGGGAPTFGNVASNNANSGSITINRPAGTVSGSLLLAQIAVRGGTTQTITAPAGWTLVPTNGRVNSGVTLAQAIYYRIAGAAEPASYQWTFSSSARSTGIILRYSGTHATTPINVSDGLAAGSGTVITAPTVTTTVANTRLVAFFSHANSAGSLTTPAGMTSRSNGNSGGGVNGIKRRATDQAIAAIGATGNKTSTASNSAARAGHLVALRPTATVTSVVTWQEP